MRNHTAQHLLHWAIAQEFSSKKPEDPNTRPGSSSTVHHGSSVDPDRFSLRVTILGNIGQLETLVKNIEGRCREVIRAKLPVVSQEIDLSEAIEVRFFFAIEIPLYSTKIIESHCETISVGNVSQQSSCNFNRRSVGRTWE